LNLKFFFYGNFRDGKQCCLSNWYKIDPSQVTTLINSSNLSAAQKATIIGFKIIRKQRNKQISCCKGMLRNVNKYKKDEEEYIYPNYPYNDTKADAFFN
jgi:hypothetical protein